MLITRLSSIKMDRRKISYVDSWFDMLVLKLNFLLLHYLLRRPAIC
jgi:hypothetical protein